MGQDFIKLSFLAVFVYISSGDCILELVSSEVVITYAVHKKKATVVSNVSQSTLCNVYWSPVGPLTTEVLVGLSGPGICVFLKFYR